MTETAPDHGRQAREAPQGRGADAAAGVPGTVFRIPAIYRALLEEHLAYRRAALFRELLQGDRVMRPSDWREERERLRLPSRSEPFCVALAEVDGYVRLAARYSPRDRQLLKYALTKAASELADASGLKLWTEWLESRRLGMMFLRSRFGPGRLEDAAAVCERLRAWTAQHLGFTVTIGVGDPVPGPQRLAASFSQAEEALQAKIVRGTDRVILYRDIRHVRAGSPLGERWPEIRDIAVLFRKGEPKWRDAFRRLFQDERLRDLSRDDAVTLVNMLVVFLDREMTEFVPADTAGWWKTRTEPALRGIAAGMESLAEAREAFLAALRECEEQLKRMRKARPSAAVFEQMREYIDANYANPDLSLAHLGGLFGLSPKSVSHLFKEQSGVNFVDYLARVRMEQAKRLLLTSDEPIPGVAARVGYVHAVSFNRMFKKVVGITPGEFRKRYRMKGRFFKGGTLYTSIQEQPGVRWGVRSDRIFVPDAVRFPETVERSGVRPDPGGHRVP